MNNPVEEYVKISVDTYIGLQNENKKLTDIIEVKNKKILEYINERNNYYLEAQKSIEKDYNDMINYLEEYNKDLIRTLSVIEKKYNFIIDWIIILIDKPFFWLLYRNHFKELNKELNIKI